MKRGSPYLYAFFFSLILGGSAYLASDQWIVALGVLALSFVASSLLFVPSLLRHLQEERVRHECYQFVNSFLITLSVCQSLDHSYEVAVGGIQGEFKDLTTKITHMRVDERIEYLKDYFRLEIYAMFVSILRLYIDRGGDVLNLASELLNELTRIEETGRYLSGKKRRNAVQFVLMWTMALLVMCFVRFGLNSFFDSIKTSRTFLLGITVFYGFLLIAFYIYLRVYTRPLLVARKEDSSHGKPA